MTVDSVKHPETESDRWIADAACNGNTSLPFDAWWPTSGVPLVEDNYAAIRTCLGCPVLDRCEGRPVDFVDVSDPVTVVQAARVRVHRPSKPVRVLLCVLCGVVSGLVVSGVCPTCRAVGKAVA